MHHSTIRKMRIGINAHFFKYPTTGIGQYLIHLSNTLLDIDQNNTYHLFHTQAQIPAAYHHPQQIIHHKMPQWLAGNANAEQFVWEQFTTPNLAQRHQVDLLHYPYFAAPLIPRQPTIVTIPDMIHLRIPDYLAGINKKMYIQANKIAASKAALILTLSQHAKQDIVELLHVPPERVRVIYLAASDDMRPIDDPQICAEVQTRYDINANYIFYLGGLDKRKNVLQLIHAFARLLQRLPENNLQLFIAGDPEKQAQQTAMFPDPRPLVEALQLSRRVIFKGVAEQDKAALYSGAQLFVYPSSYEGFGLPPLEAMQCGAPVICSNRSSLPEVVGNAALSIQTDNTQKLADALYAMLTNQELRTDFCQRSLKQARRFSWLKTATQTLSAYEDVLRQTQQ